MALVLCAFSASQSFVSPAIRLHPRQLQGYRQAFPWEFSSASTDRAYNAWAAAFPAAAQSGQYLGEATDKNLITSRINSLIQSLGDDLALEILQKEPVLLFRDANGIRLSLEYLQGLETSSQKGLATEAIRKNPKLLTIPQYEYERSKPSLDSLASAATAIDFLRPLGDLGLTVAIFGSFVVIITILRPLLYGVGGGPSLVSAVFGQLPSIPRPYELLEGTGINLSALIVIYPLLVVVKGIFESRTRSN